MNKNHIRGITTEMRRQLSLKSYSCPESRAVYAAVMSAEVSALYPGRSGSLLHAELPAPRGEGKGVQKSAEGIVGAAPGSEGPKREEKTSAVMSMESGVAATRAEMPSATHRGGVRNTPGRGIAVTRPTVVMEPSAST
jgi:hypothetical protein